MSTTPNFCLILNAHLPYVRYPEFPEFFEERWLFEAIAESYVPLLDVFARLDADGVPFKLAMTISPTLVSMLGDELLVSRFEAYLEKQIGLARKELERCAGRGEELALAKLYLDRYEGVRESFMGRLGRDLVRAFDFYSKKGRLELLSTCATHCFLPLYEAYPEAVAAQVSTAVAAHAEAFGKSPSGFWLPEMGYSHGIEDALAENGIDYTVLATHGILFGSPPPAHGSYAPLKFSNGVKAFARDIASTRSVWSEKSGYPADPCYRDFYRDIGFDLPLDYLAPWLIEGRIRIPLGFKYHAVTGPTDEKRLYRPDEASAKAREHARDFFDKRVEQLSRAARAMGSVPTAVAPYDAELFGHWWFEGPVFIEELLRIQAERRSELCFTSPQEVLKRCGELAEIEPEFSSWGSNGYAETWLGSKNDWIYRHIHKAIERMMDLVERFPEESGLRTRALNQAAREVLLAQSSDWAFMLKHGGCEDFARRKVQEHLGNFTKIYDFLSCNTVSTEWLTRLEKKDRLFPWLDYRVFKRKARSQ